MIVRLPPAFVGMPSFYIDDETGAPLFNDRGELANDNDMRRFLGRPEVSRELERLTLEMCAEERRKGEMLPPWLLQAELEAFQRARKREAA